MSQFEINAEALEIARKAVEDRLVDFRDSRISNLLAENGFTIREKNGDSPGVIRLSTEDGLRIGIRAYLEATKND